KDGVSVPSTIETIKGLAEYQNMKVEYSVDEKSIASKADTLTAPINLVGTAVVLLAISAIIVLFATNEKPKRTFISKMSSIGATKKQIAGIIMVETAMFAVSGSLIGGALAVLIYKFLLQWTLSSVMTYSVSIPNLLLSMSLGMIVSMFAGFLPMLLARRHSVRENLLATAKSNWKIKFVMFACILVSIIVCLVFEFILETASVGVFAIVAFLLIIVSIVIFSPTVLSVVERITKKLKKLSPEFKIATINLSRTQSSRRGIQIIALGMTVCVMLFVAWNVSTAIYATFTSEFSDMVLVSNVPTDETLSSEFEEISGVYAAFPVIWKRAKVQIAGAQRSINVLGTKEILNCADFEFVTDEQTTRNILAAGLDTDERYVFLDYSYTVLYGVKVGDHFTMTLEDKTAEFVVGGILKHELFTGNYMVVAREQMTDAFELPQFDTIMMFVDDVEKMTGELRVMYADRNFFVIGALDSFRYEIEAMDDVFALIGVLAFVITGMVAVSVVSNTIVSRTAKSKGRTQLLIAGMSKKGMFKEEIFEHLLTAIVAFVLSFGFSTLLTACLIDSLLLFEVYLDYVFALLPSLLVSAVMSIAYIIMPFVCNYKKHYSLAGKGINE
ncbi:MAG: FtsX-like permease family protein, partial [Clostridia bacterium]|nr:FtsX-like permease family protein [Clostridia bacterium]